MLLQTRMTYLLFKSDVQSLYCAFNIIWVNDQRCSPLPVLCVATKRKWNPTQTRLATVAFCCLAFGQRNKFSDYSSLEKASLMLG